MPIYNDSPSLKKMLHQRCLSLDRFNALERQMMNKPDVQNCLAAVFELYEMIPDKARQRPVNVAGIMKMREGLACLI